MGPLGGVAGRRHAREAAGAVLPLVGDVEVPKVFNKKKGSPPILDATAERAPISAEHQASWHVSPRTRHRGHGTAALACASQRYDIEEELGKKNKTYGTSRISKSTSRSHTSVGTHGFGGPPGRAGAERVRGVRGREWGVGMASNAGGGKTESLRQLKPYAKNRTPRR